MKYRARIEKLDYTGTVKVTFRDMSDDFRLSSDALVETIKTGSLDRSMIGSPDVQYWSLRSKIAPSRGRAVFDDHEPGIRFIAGEHIAGIGAQYVVYDRSGKRQQGWAETDRDLTGGSRDE